MNKKHKVLIIDDLLDTGDRLKAAEDLIDSHYEGVHIAGSFTMFEIPALGGKFKLK